LVHREVFQFIAFVDMHRKGGTSPTPWSRQGEKLTFVLYNFAGDTDSGIGCHLFWTESSTFIALFAEFGGAVFGLGQLYAYGAGDESIPLGGSSPNLEV
jgi:hypothetical protein